VTVTIEIFEEERMERIEQGSEAIFIQLLARLSVVGRYYASELEALIDFQSVRPKTREHYDVCGAVGKKN
jgi:hypothetical protein